ncbi:MAG: MltA domain-containing protein [Oxalobacter sp.]|nr:MltA domain-containing protein [Oxalobacter sp.]
MPYRRYLTFAALSASLLLTACSDIPFLPDKPQEVKLPDTQVVRHQKRVRFSEIPGWRQDDVKAVWPAFMRSCQANSELPQWQKPCVAAQSVDGGNSQAVREYFEEWFNPYVIMTDSGSDTGLATGYYEPVLRGSYEKRGAFQTAMYREPADLLDIEFTEVYPQLKGMRLRGHLASPKPPASTNEEEAVAPTADLLQVDISNAYPKVAGLQMWGRKDGKKVVPYAPPGTVDYTNLRPAARVVPYETRGQIEASGKLKGQEILWVDDVIDAFFLEIQGSGRVYLPESNKTVRLAYANQNGRPYRSIGRYLLDKRELKPGQASAQQIKQWVRKHPNRLREVLDANPSYVFFREEKLTDPNEGPKGSQGVPLTPGRSIAVDGKYIPMGTPVFLDTTMPNSKEPLRRLVMAQDTGGAIAGPVRADFFWGWGNEAGRMAGKMKQKLRVWLLLPKS